MNYYKMIIVLYTECSKSWYLDKMVALNMLRTYKIGFFRKYFLDFTTLSMYPNALNKSKYLIYSIFAQPYDIKTMGPNTFKNSQKLKYGGRGHKIPYLSYYNLHPTFKN